MKKKDSCLGAGIGFRHEISKEIFNYVDDIDFLEIIPERYFINKQLLSELYALAEKFLLIPHGVSLSIASPSLDWNHLERIKEICQITQCPYYSEHLALTRSPGIDLGHLSPVLFTEENLRYVTNNVNRVQDYLKIPLVLENITYNFEQPCKTIDQTQFFQKLIDETGCKMLLDVTNVHTNAYNHANIHPYEFIDQLPLQSVEQYHVAGGYYTDDDMLIDGHNQPVEEKSWELLEYAVQKKKIVKGVILEHDDDFPEDFSQLLKQLRIARMILNDEDWKSELHSERKLDYV